MNFWGNPHYEATKWHLTTVKQWTRHLSAFDGAMLFSGPMFGSCFRILAVILVSDFFLWTSTSQTCIWLNYNWQKYHIFHEGTPLNDRHCADPAEVRRSVNPLAHVGFTVTIHSHPCFEACLQPMSWQHVHLHLPVVLLSGVKQGGLFSSVGQHTNLPTETNAIKN